MSGAENEELSSIEQLEKAPYNTLSLKEKVLVYIYHFIQKAGFIGIFLCASVIFLIMFIIFFYDLHCDRALEKKNYFDIIITVNKFSLRYNLFGMVIPEGKTDGN